MVLLYGMNCIDYTIGPIYLIVSPKMLLGASIDEAQLLGDALKQYLATSKSKVLFHIGCGYGLTTLMMINVIIFSKLSTIFFKKREYYNIYLMFFAVLQQYYWFGSSIIH